MAKSSNRKLKKNIAYSLIALAILVVVGNLIYPLLRTNSIDDLYGPYPADAHLKTLEIVNPGAPRPNVVIIYCDDLGYGDLGIYGSRAIRTPNVDRLAAGGSRFTNYYACNAVCAPSRAGLLTGRYPFRTGVIGNPYPGDEPLAQRAVRKLGSILKGLGVLDIREDYVAGGLSEKEITLAEALQTAGYRTGMIGKWHLGDYSRQPAYNPVRHGFDFYFGVPHSNDMRPFPLYRNEARIEADIGSDQARLTGLYTSEAVKFIEAREEGPFFLYLAHTFPHQPLFASQQFAGKSKAGKYGDAVEEIDWSVGEIVRCLARTGIADNTLIFFTSDNGPWFEGSPGSLRGRKGQSYEGGFRVPFIASWPGRIPRKQVNSLPVMNLDLFPTLLALAGVGLPADRVIDGFDISGLLTGKEKTLSWEAIYFYHYDLLEGVRSGKWKYFKKVNRYTWPVPVDAAPVLDRLGSKQLGNRWPLLYDLELDPQESYNVLSTYPDKAAELAALLTQWEQAAAVNPRGFRKPASASLRD
jgi:arylsulfatase A-like enzyme